MTQQSCLSPTFSSTLFTLSALILPLHWLPRQPARCKQDLRLLSQALPAAWLRPTLSRPPCMQAL